MFDKLIVSESSDVKDRRSYFMASSLFVGVLFLAAVVISIYASDYGLGSDSFEISMLAVPPEIAAVEPKPLQPRVAANPSQPQNSSPSKPAFVAPMSDPNNIPKTVSTTPIAALTWNSPEPAPALSDMHSRSFGERNATDAGDGSVGISSQTQQTEPAAIPDPPPPPIIKKPVDAKSTVVRSEGAINGKATLLPKPTYPVAAVAINLQGKVDVQVTIDENGKVISAKAVSGNALFRAGAERAAWQAKFTPTYLSKVPVKVTGVIVYNFTR